MLSNRVLNNAIDILPTEKTVIFILTALMVRRERESEVDWY